MRRLLKQAEQMKLPGVFKEEGGLKVSDEVQNFLKENLLETARNIAVEEGNDVAILHFVLDRAALEQEMGDPIDDASCKVLVSHLDDSFKNEIVNKIQELAQSELHLTVNKIDCEFEYGDGVFHTIATCS